MQFSPRGILTEYDYFTLHTLAVLDDDCSSNERPAESSYANTIAADVDTIPSAVPTVNLEPTCANVSAAEAEPNYAALELAQGPSMDGLQY